mmetsp:Transcript_14765/g.39831  ORF Transcript_14765/g.39831 Transcript_14765/m.39831 type:complete len:278 (+) Transcript_14765:599-1432(+)
MHVTLVGGQQLACGPVQQSQGGVQACSQHALPIMRNGTAGDWLVQLVHVHATHTHVKAPHGAIHAAGDDLSVAHNHGGHAVFECLHGLHRVHRARLAVPNFHALVIARSDQAVIVGSVRDRVDGAVMALELPDEPGSADIPDKDLLVTATGCKFAVIPSNAYITDFVAMATIFFDQNSAQRVPQADIAVLASSHTVRALLVIAHSKDRALMPLQLRYLMRWQAIARVLMLILFWQLWVAIHEHMSTSLAINHLILVGIPTQKLHEPSKCQRSFSVPH